MNELIRTHRIIWTTQHRTIATNILMSSTSCDTLVHTVCVCVRWVTVKHLQQIFRLVSTFSSYSEAFNILFKHHFFFAYNIFTRKWFSVCACACACACACVPFDHCPFKSFSIYAVLYGMCTGNDAHAHDAHIAMESCVHRSATYGSIGKYLVYSESKLRCCDMRILMLSLTFSLSLDLSHSFSLHVCCSIVVGVYRSLDVYIRFSQSHDIRLASNCVNQYSLRSSLTEIPKSAEWGSRETLTTRKAYDEYLLLEK